jgi:hypothetical protein
LNANANVVVVAVASILVGASLLVARVADA